MSRKQVAQLFTNNGYIPAKASLHLRPVGESQDYFELNNSEDTVIDAVNFQNIDQEDSYFTLEDSNLDFTGTGYLLSHSSSLVEVEDAAVVSYPFLGLDDGKYYIHIRIKSTENYKFTTLVDNVPYKTIEGGAADWGWITTDFIVFDEARHSLGFAVQSNNLYIDKIVISKSGDTPNSYGPDYSVSPYCTIITRLSTVNSVPDNYFNVLSAKNTIDNIVSDGWYNFDLTTLDDVDVSIYDEFAVCVIAAGVSSEHYIVWDTAEEINEPTATQLDSDGWVLDSLSSMAIQIYSYTNSVDENCILHTPDAVLTTFEQDDFASSIRPKLQNVIYVDDANNGSDVELNLNEKLISFVIDNSGSQTWNDNSGVKYQFANEVLDVIAAKYPSDIKYNLFEFKGEPCFSFFVALENKLTEPTVANIIRETFKNDSSYFAGFRVLRKEGSFSETPIDGEIVSDGYAFAALDIDLKEDTQYYYTVYTYDQKYRFSNGVQLQAKTAEKIIPRGIPNFTGFCVKGYDLRADSNTVAMWNSDETQGNYVYDFAGSTTLNLENTKWLSIFDSPAGISGLRFNGLNSRAYAAANPQLSISFSDEFTVEGWIYPFESQPDQTVITQSNSTNKNWILKLDGLTVQFELTEIGNLAECSTELQADAWNHVAVTYNNGLVKFYINGELINSDNITTQTTLQNSDMYIAWGYDPSGENERFFGKLSHISLHNTERSASEISGAASPARGTDDNGNPQPVDNGDRLVILDYVIPADNNYSDVRIVRNATKPPAHETDGTIILNTTATAGRHTFSASYPYDLAHNYYFRIFTKNEYGNWCDISDAHLLNISIPDLSRPEYVDDISGVKSTPGPGLGDTGPVTMEISRAGNEKVHFRWTPPDDDTTRVRIYYSSVSFPVYDSELKSVVGGALIFDGTTDITEFVHRKVSNRATGYYVILTADRLGRIQSPGGWFATTHFPIAEIDDSGIPLLEALNVSYHLQDYDRIKITWDSPVVIDHTFSAYYDERFYIYGAICDLYGNPLPLDFPENVNINFVLNPLSATTIEDVFNVGLSTENINSIPAVDTKINADGLITGLVRLRPSPLFAVIQKLSLSVSASYNLSAGYTFKFPSATLGFNNPLQMELVNRDNLFFNTFEYAPPDGCPVDDESGGRGEPNNPARKRVNGTHIRRKLPFVIRAFYTYKGEALNSSRIAVKIFDADGGPCGITANTKAISKTVVLKQNGFPLIKETKPILDGNGNPTIYSETLSYSDLLVVAPQLPQSASVFVKLEGGGYISLKKMHIFFPTVLKIEISASAPDSNSTDVREQFGRAYLVDPDFPLDENKRTYPPENTIAKWTVTSNNNKVTNIPFYSIDNVPLANGVYSYFRSGTARNIFFGPANPTVAGIYRITISATVRGLFATTFQDVEIKGKAGSTFEHFIPDPLKPRILCEFENTVNYLWSDGLDYQKMTITRNPTNPVTSNTKYASKFRECSDVMFPLPPGTVITVEAKGYEILHGDVTEYVDAENNRRLVDTNAYKSNDVAQIQLTNDQFSYVYFRKNEFISDVGCSEIDIVPCAAFDAPETICFDPYDIGDSLGVIVSTKINLAGKPLTIFGGGGFGNDGRPPCVLVPVEPLYVRYLGLFVNNVPVDTFAIDGNTVHHMYFEIRFAGNLVTSGTPFEVFACNLVPDPPLAEGESCRRINADIDVPLFVYAYLTNQLPGQSISDQEYSIIDIPIGPIAPEGNFSIGIWPNIVFND